MYQTFKGLFMKRYVLHVGMFLCCLISLSAFAQKKQKPTKEAVAVADSIEFYEVEIGVNQKNYMAQLAGAWVIDTMRTQARALPEPLSGVVIRFDSDSTFSGNTGCNHVNGTFRLKGTSIRFLTLQSIKAACEGAESEAALQRLLMRTVSAYTVENDVLLLRDGSSNIVFHAHRKKD